MGVLDNTAATSGLLNGHFSEMYPDHSSADAPPEQFAVTEWDPHADFGGALAIPPFDSCLIASATVADPMPTIPRFASGGFSNIIAQFDVPGDCDRGKKRKSPSGCDAANSNSSPRRTWDGSEQTNDSQPKQSPRIDGSKQSEGSNARKPITKQGKSGVDGKEDYIHVRAKRGQATNSHSLAERVRREKISERMRFLQNLVPGCNKITGKAVMLDEIINYVQSLQRQVEFLSMKLATVSPEINFDMMQLLTKDMLHTAGGCSAAVGFEQGMSYSMCHHSSGFVPQPSIQQEIFPQGASNPREVMRHNATHVSPTHHAGGWDDGLHNSLQMAFVSHMSTANVDTEPPINQG